MNVLADAVRQVGCRPMDLRFGTRRISPAAIEIIPPQGYRSPAWHVARLSSVSASEIAVVLGISPYASRFDLWWAKKLAEQGQDDNAAMRRGRRVEPLVIEDFAEAHQEFSVQHVGLCQNVLRGWQVATPDALAGESWGSRHDRWRDEHDGTVADWPLGVVEAKTAANRDGWGEPGTDEIPVHYRAQVLWQLDTLGLRTAFVPVWLAYDYKEYVVEWDEGDVLFMRDAAREFLTSLEQDEQPDVDSHPATTARLKRLHPSVVDGDAEVPAAAVSQYHAAKRLRDAAQDRMSLAENRIRHAMGDNRVAAVDGRKVASRSVYDVPAATVERKAYTVNRLNISRAARSCSMPSSTTRRGPKPAPAATQEPRPVSPARQGRPTTRAAESPPTPMETARRGSKNTASHTTPVTRTRDAGGTHSEENA